MKTYCVIVMAPEVIASSGSLHCLRNTIHCHLIVAFILRNLLWLTMFSVLKRLTENIHLTICEVLCKAIVALFNYLLLATFFWMLVEGLYIHTIIVCAFGASSLRLWYYALIGWGAPLIFVVAWSIVRATVEESVDSDVSYRCWLQHPNNVSPYDYIFITPILCILLVNMIFLGSVVFVLITKLQDPNSAQTAQYRKAVRATVVLLPLLGIIYVILITNPVSDSHISRLVFVYFNSVIQSTQGLLVAVFYCFLNAEVRTVVASRFTSWLANHQSSAVVRYTPAHTRSTIVMAQDVNNSTPRKEKTTLVGLRHSINSNPGHIPV